MHVTSINTETDFEGAGEEFTGDAHMPWFPAGGFGAAGEYLAWVEADLKRASDDPSVAWIVAAGHRPFEDLPAAHAAQLVDLFARYKVAFYFCGHGHTYNRHLASDWGDGAVHIMSGGAGNDETPFPPDQFDPVATEVGPREACLAWCAGAEVRATQAKGGKEPCRHCAPANGVPSPVFFTDKMSAGVLTASRTELTWKLARSRWRRPGHRHRHEAVSPEAPA